MALVHVLQAAEECAEALVQALQVAFELALAAVVQRQDQHRQLVQHRNQLVPVQAVLDARAQGVRLCLVGGRQVHLVEQTQQAGLDVRGHRAVGWFRHRRQGADAVFPGWWLGRLEQRGGQRQAVQQDAVLRRG
ncbi:hypothetical protein D9M71_531480 [compost metagenome]